MNPFKISFLIPGYLPPDRLIEPGTAENSSHAPVAIHWEGGRIQQPWQANFEQHMGLQDSSGLHLPMARLMCKGYSESSGLVCADPIHLQADRDTAKVIPAEMLALTDDEADSLLKGINAFLQADSMSLHRDASGGWFMSGMDATSLASFPPSFLANRNASAYMPEGEGSGSWRRLMTELQMLLHAHPVNDERGRLGKQAVNSLWFWGGAPLYSPVTGPGEGLANSITAVGTVYADDEFAQAACAHLKVPCKPLDDFDPMLCEDALVVDTRIAKAIFARNESEMHQVIEQIDQQWLEPMSQRIKDGQVQQIEVVNEDGDTGILNRDLQRAHSRSESRLTSFLNSIKVPEQVMRWFSRAR